MTKAQRILDDLVDVAIVPGISAALSIEGKVVWTGQSGFADIEKQKLVSKNTQFRTASVAKVITATALLKLLQEGKVNLDKDIRVYVPEFPEKKWSITSRQLAAHTSGIERDAARFEDKFYTSVSDAINVFKEFPLLFEPNTEFLYSTHGYVLLSAVVESAAKRPFLDYIESELLEPLSMTLTGPHDIHHPTKNTVTFYARSGTDLSPIEELEDPSYMWGGGGLLSTPSDLAKLGKAYFSEFFDPEIIEEAFRSYQMKSGDEPGIGIGWRLNEDFYGEQVVEHNGIMQGARSMLSLYPNDDIAVSFMANRRWGTFGSRTVHLLKHVLLGTAESNPLRIDERYKGNFRGSKVEGYLKLEDDKGMISVPQEFRNWVGMPDLKELPIYHLDGLTWIIVTPFGLLDMSFNELKGERVNGHISFNHPDNWSIEFNK